MSKGYLVFEMPENIDNKTTEANAVDAAVETLRHLPHDGRKAAKRMAFFSGKSSPRLTDRQKQIAGEIRAELDNYFPQKQAFNPQKKYLLNAIQKEQIGREGQNVTPDRYNDIIQTTQAKQPHFAQSVDPHNVAELASHLQQYSKYNEGKFPQFPQLAVLGHRTEERTLMPSGSEPAKRLGKVSERQTNNFSGLNASLNALVPEGTYYNKLRQSVIDTVNTHANDMVEWKSIEDANTREIAASGDPQKWLPNNKHFKKQDVMTAIEGHISPHRDDIFISVGASKSLTRDSVMRSGTRLQEYQEISKRNGRSRGSVTQAPQTIHDAVRNLEEPTPLNPAAKKLAKSAAEQANQIVPPRNGNFESRKAFMEQISSVRSELISGKSGSVDEIVPESGTLFNLRQRFYQAFNQKPQQIEKLAQTLNDYHRVYQGKALERDSQSSTIESQPAKSARMVEPKSAGKSDLRGKITKPSSNSRHAKALARAASATGQTKLSFSSADGKLALKPASSFVSALDSPGSTKSRTASRLNSGPSNSQEPATAQHGQLNLVVAPTVQTQKPIDAPNAGSPGKNTDVEMEDRSKDRDRANANTR
ncbi:MAG: hypothetical protein AAGF25_11380 [Pseudomonadota bacterium]